MKHVTFKFFQNENPKHEMRSFTVSDVFNISINIWKNFYFIDIVLSKEETKELKKLLEDYIAKK